MRVCALSGDSVMLKKSKGGRVIKRRHQQPSLWHKGLAKDIEDLCETVDERKRTIC